MSSSSSHNASHPLTRHRVAIESPARSLHASTRPRADTNQSINQSPRTNHPAGRYASRPDVPRALAGRGRRVRSLVRPRETSTGHSTRALDSTVARVSIVRRVDVCARVVRRVDIMHDGRSRDLGLGRSRDWRAGSVSVVRVGYVITRARFGNARGDVTASRRVVSVDRARTRRTRRTRRERLALALSRAQASSRSLVAVRIVRVERVHRSFVHVRQRVRRFIGFMSASTGAGSRRAVSVSPPRVRLGRRRRRALRRRRRALRLGRPSHRLVLLV